MVKVQVEIQLKSGLHARPTTRLVQEAMKYTSEITLVKGERSVNAKSMMSVLSLGATKGDIIELEVSGEDEDQAKNAILDILKSEE